MAKAENTTETEKRVALSLENLARVGQHVIIVITVVTLCFGPLWHAQVAQPMEALKARTAKLEAALEVQNKQIASIDKNLAIMSERLAQIKESLDKYFKRD